VINRYRVLGRDRGCRIEPLVVENWSIGAMDRRSPGDDWPRGCAPNRLSRLVGKGLQPMPDSRRTISLPLSAIPAQPVPGPTQLRLHAPRGRSALFGRLIGRSDQRFDSRRCDSQSPVVLAGQLNRALIASPNMLSKNVNRTRVCKTLRRTLQNWSQVEIKRLLSH
jgi:hypothetical protein